MNGMPVHIGSALHGASLPAVLQLLEHERSSCTLMVTNEGRNGRFFFRDGHLIDADWDGKAGLEAAHALLTLQKPDFTVSASEDRMTRIRQPLARILFQATDRTGLAKPATEVTLPGEESFAEEVKTCPQILRLLTEIIAIPEIKHYCLLNRKGKLVASSTKKNQFCNFVSYAIMCSLQMRKGLGNNIKGPNRIQMLLGREDALLIQPGAGMIIGLLVEGSTSLSALSAKIRSGLAR